MPINNGQCMDDIIKFVDHIMTNFKILLLLATAPIPLRGGKEVK